MRRGEATGTILIAALLFLVSSGAVEASWVVLEMDDLVDRTEAIAVLRVTAIGGEPYGQWAELQVEETLRGELPETIRLPFVYAQYPEGPDGIRAFVSGVLQVSFEVDRRYLVMLEEARGPVGHNPHQAITPLHVLQYHEHTFVPVASSDDPPVWMMQRTLEVLDAPDARSASRALMPMLSHGSVEVRRTATNLAATRDVADAEAILLAALLADPAEEVRQAAAHSLGRKGGGTRVSAALLAAAEDGSASVRHAAVTALYTNGATEAVPGLLELYPRATPDSRNVILTALGLLGGPRVLAALREFFHETSEFGRKSVILNTAAMLDTEEAVEFLLEVLESDEPDRVRAAAARALGRLETPRGVATRLDSARESCDGSNVARIEALISTLPRIATNGERFPILEEHASCRYEGVRRQAAYGLASLGTPEARALLAERAEIERNNELRNEISVILNEWR